MYILENFLILLHISHIVYKFSKILSDRFSLTYYLYILFCNLTIIGYTEDTSDLFLKEKLFLENR